MSDMIDRVAKVIWQQIIPGNLHKDWDAQPDSVKLLPRQRAKMIISMLMHPTPVMIEAGELEKAEGGDMVAQWQVMAMAAVGMPWSRIRDMLDRDQDPGHRQ
ncbi:hypothetical protein [Microvirga aerophila]|uniref:Uncharacterized protein n=1 Tax=Microvirga aerophila TaxID=670291 RepID=A0A512C3F9_9HYPH|nr:hypothetical protein [Microvirga aerophila]GEO18752.1 hypothetical protein MAE02_64480 [Microvirga aerophila]